MFAALVEISAVFTAF